MLCGMWDHPGSGIEPVSPTLAGGFLTTEPPGKPNSQDFKLSHLLVHCTDEAVALHLGWVRQAVQSHRAGLVSPISNLRCFLSRSPLWLSGDPQQCFACISMGVFYNRLPPLQAAEEYLLLTTTHRWPEGADSAFPEVRRVVAGASSVSTQERFLGASRLAGATESAGLCHKGYLPVWVSPGTPRGVKLSSIPMAALPQIQHQRS